jgi:hypothetical protein
LTVTKLEGRKGSEKERRKEGKVEKRTLYLPVIVPRYEEIPLPFNAQRISSKGAGSSKSAEKWKGREEGKGRTEEAALVKTSAELARDPRRKALELEVVEDLRSGDLVDTVLNRHRVVLCDEFRVDERALHDVSRDSEDTLSSETVDVAESEGTKVSFVEERKRAREKNALDEGGVENLVVLLRLHYPDLFIDLDRHFIVLRVVGVGSDDEVLVKTVLAEFPPRKTCFVEGSQFSSAKGTGRREGERTLSVVNPGAACTKKRSVFWRERKGKRGGKRRKERKKQRTHLVIHSLMLRRPRPSTDTVTSLDEENIEACSKQNRSVAAKSKEGKEEGRDDAPALLRSREATRPV